MAHKISEKKRPAKIKTAAMKKVSAKTAKIATENKHAFAASEKAWHGLGTVTGKPMTTTEAIVLGGLDYTVEKFPSLGYVKNELVETGSFYTKRTDTDQILGPKIGRGYTVLQNAEAFAFLDSIVEQSDGVVESVGALGNGETVFISCKLPKNIHVGDDVVEQYFLITNSHDGSSSVTVMFTPVNVVCNNTLNLALRGTQNRVRVSHTKNVEARMNQSAKILGIHKMYSSELEREFKKMRNVKMADSTFDKFVVNLIGSPKGIAKLGDGASFDECFPLQTRNVITDLREYWRTGAGQESFGKNKWGAYNAVTGYFQNVKEYASDERKFMNIIRQEGGAAKVGQKAFAMLAN